MDLDSDLTISESEDLDLDSDLEKEDFDLDLPLWDLTTYLHLRNRVALNDNTIYKQYIVIMLIEMQMKT